MESSGILMTSVTLVERSFSCSSVARCLLSAFRARISCSDSSLSSGRKKSCSSSATSEDCRLTSTGDVSISPRIFNWTFSLGVSSSLERKSAAAFCEPATCMIRNLNRRT